jgi:hypothetical protein
MNYYVVNAGRGRSATHVMWSRTPEHPEHPEPRSIAAQLLWFGGNAKYTLSGLQTCEAGPSSERTGFAATSREGRNT